MNSLFLDTSYAIALSVTSDEHHTRAVELSLQLETVGATFITTRAVIMEIGNALSKRNYRQASVQLLDSLEHDFNVTVHPLTEERYQQAFDLYRNRPDKEWGLVDCLSFIVMREHNLTDALTADDHFRQAGFKALLKET